MSGNPDKKQSSSSSYNDDEEEGDEIDNNNNCERRGKGVSFFRFSSAKKKILLIQQRKKRRKKGGVLVNNNNNSRVSGKWIGGGFGCCLCMKQPMTLDSSAESPASDPNSKEFTCDLLKVFIEKNDFYSRECNPHLVVDDDDK